MSEIRRLFLQMKKKCLLSRQDNETARQRDSETKKTTTTKTFACRKDKDEDEEKGSAETKKRGVGSIRRTPDLIKSHPQTKLPPLPPNQNSSFHGIIRGYPPVSGHIYEEISSTAAAAVHSGSSGELPAGGRGGVFYISPIDGALHRLHPEQSDRIVCPHLRCYDSGTPPSPAPFTPRLFGKTVNVCGNCARSLRERLASSSEPDVIYPTYWRPTDTGRSGVRNRHPPPPPPPAPPPFPGDPVQSDSENSVGITTDVVDRERFRQGIRNSESKMATSVDNVAVLDRLSCRATNYRPPRPEARSSLSRSEFRGHRFSRSPHEARTSVATSRSMNNLLLSDVLRLNHDRRFLFGNLQFSSNDS